MCVLLPVVVRISSCSHKSTIMTSFLGSMNIRQREILECVSNLRDLLTANTNPKEINLQCLRIEQYANDTLAMSYAFMEHLRHLRREKRRRHRKNKKEYTEWLQKYVNDYQSVVETFALKL